MRRCGKARELGDLWLLELFGVTIMLWMFVGVSFFLLGYSINGRWVKLMLYSFGFARENEYRSLCNSQ